MSSIIGKTKHSPHKILQYWDGVLPTLGLCKSDYDALYDFFSYTLPYPAQKSIDLCLQAYREAGYELKLKNKKVISRMHFVLKEMGEIAEGRVSYVQSNPLAYGLIKIMRSADRLGENKKVIIKGYLELFHLEVFHSKKILEDEYYYSVNTVRDILIILCERIKYIGIYPHSSDEVINAVRDIARKVIDDKLYIDQEFYSDLKWEETPFEWYPTVTDIVFNIVGDRKSKCLLVIKYGRYCDLPSRIRPTFPTLYERGNTTKRVDNLVKKTCERLEIESFADVWKENQDQPIGKDETIVYDVESDDIDNPEKEKLNSDTYFEKEKIKNKRKKPSRIAINKQRLESESDRNRLPESLVYRSVRQLFNVPRFFSVFALLVYILGIDEKRLAEIKLYTGRANKPGVYLDPVTHVLSYEIFSISSIVKQEVKEGEVPNSHRIAIRLPEILAVDLVEACKNDELLGIVEKINKQLKRSFKGVPGARVNLKRIRASCFLFERKHFSRFDARIKRGDLTEEFRVTSAYRMVTYDRVNKKIGMAVDDLVGRWTERECEADGDALKFKNWLESIKPDDREIRGVIGSEIYQHPHCLSGFVGELKKNYKLMRKALQSAYETKRFEMLVDFINLLQINYYLLYLISTQARPGRKVTQIGSNRFGFLIADKSTGSHWIRRFIPKTEASLLQKQIDQLENIDERLEKLVSDHGITIRKLPEYQGLCPPCLYKIDRKNKAIAIVRLTSGRFEKLLGKYNLSEYFQFESNLTRHQGATVLSALVKTDAFAKHIMAHTNGIGIDVPESTASIESYRRIASLIDEYVKIYGLGLFKIDEEIWHGRYG